MLQRVLFKRILMKEQEGGQKSPRELKERLINLASVYLEVGSTRDRYFS